jgi:hypothetical protein
MLREREYGASRSRARSEGARVGSGANTERGGAEVGGEGACCLRGAGTCESVVAAAGWMGEGLAGLNTAWR